MLVLFQLVEDEVLEGFGIEGSGELAIADFLYRPCSSDRVLSSQLCAEGLVYLDIPSHVALHGLEGC